YNFMRVSFWIMSLIILYNYIKHVSIFFIKKSIELFILFLSCILAVQLISVYAFDYIIDFSILIGGDEVRSFSSGFFPYRPTAVFSEPSIFSGVMLCLITIYYILSGNSKVILAGLASMALTFSILGVFLAFIAFSIIFYKNNFKNLILILFFFSLGFYFFNELLASRYDSFLQGDDSSNNIKIDVLNYLASSWEILFFGYGVIGKGAEAPSYFEALYDLTFFINMISMFGTIFGGFILFYIISEILKIKVTFRMFILIFLSLVKISSPMMLFFNFFIMMLFVLKYKGEVGEL
ncbi:hypothetical protein, partial [Testudinibacter sp. TR-2022]